MTEPERARWMGRHVVVGSVDGKVPSRRKTDVTNDVANIRRTLFREAISFVLVLLGLVGIAICSSQIWGIWGLYLSIAVIGLVVGFAIGQ